MTGLSSLRKHKQSLTVTSVFVTTVCLAYLAIDTTADAMMQAITKLSEAPQSCDLILITAINNATTTVTYSGQETSSSTEYTLLKKSDLIECLGLKGQTAGRTTP